MPIPAVGIALAVGGAILGGVSSRKSAKASRSAIKDAIRQGEINHPFLVQQIRLNEKIELQRISRQSQRAMGATLASVSPGSNSVAEAVASRLTMGVAQDSFAIRTEARRRVEVANRQRIENITNLRNQMPSVGFATISGAIGGAQAGLRLGSAISGLAGQAASEQPRRDIAEFDSLIANAELGGARTRALYMEGRANITTQGFFSQSNETEAIFRTTRTYSTLDY